MLTWHQDLLKLRESSAWGREGRVSLSAWEVCERFKCAGSGAQPENQEGYVFMVKEK